MNAWSFVRDGQTYEVRIRNQLRVNNARALLAAASEGFGIVLIALDLVREALPRASWSADRRQTPKLQRFVETAIREFAP